MKKKILIIEDEPDVAETERLILESEGYSATAILDPRKAIKEAKKYDLIVLDIMMPIMSGREVLAEFKKMKLQKPIIVVTAVGMPGEVERELSAKYMAVRVIPKTSMHTDLIKEIKKMIG